ncbi:MAG: helix-turn-helix domain-containing protein [Nanoarchaeota archaeon]
MKEKIKIIDNSGDKEFFTIIPNSIINHSSAIDRALYIEIKRFAGEDGKCFATQQTIMKRLNIGRKAYNKALDYLLKNEWITYIGMTGGKTKPIKTYKINNIWQENTELYKKIEAERTLSFLKDRGQKNYKIEAERTTEEDLQIKEDNLNNKNYLNGNGIKINELINLFKNINPAYQKFFKIKSQRLAMERLNKQLGKDKLTQILLKISETNGIKYAPTIVSPLQLEDKLASLIAFLKKESNKGGYIQL